MAGSFEALGAYVLQLPTLLHTGQAHVVARVRERDGRAVYAVATAIDGSVMFVSADLERASLLGTGSYTCPGIRGFSSNCAVLI